MTQRTKDLLAQLEQELETLPEAEQEAYIGALLEELRRRKQNQNEETTAHPSLDILQESQIEGLPSDYSERLDHYLYGADDE